MKMIIKRSWDLRPKVFRRKEKNDLLSFINIFYHHFFLWIPVDLWTHRGMCLFAAYSLNLRPQPGHSDLSSTVGLFWILFLNYSLSFFHFGTYSTLGWGFVFSYFFICCASSLTTLTLKTLRFTSPFWHIFMCFYRAWGLNLRPQFSGHSTSYIYSIYYGY